MLAVAKPSGTYLGRVYDGSFRWLGPMERALYRVAGVRADEDQHWTQDAVTAK